MTKDSKLFNSESLVQLNNYVVRSVQHGDGTKVDLHKLINQGQEECLIINRVAYQPRTIVHMCYT